MATADVVELFVWEITEVMLHSPELWTGEKLRTDVDSFIETFAEWAYAAWYISSIEPRIVAAHLFPAGGRTTRGEERVDLVTFVARLRQSLGQFEFWQNLQHNIWLFDEADDDAAEVSDTTSGLTQQGGTGRSKDPIRAHRFGLIQAHCVRNNLAGRKGFAASIGISESSLVAVVRGERDKHSHQTRLKVLRTLRVTEHEWNKEPAP